MDSTGLAEVMLVPSADTVPTGPPYPMPPPSVVMISRSWPATFWGRNPLNNGQFSLLLFGTPHPHEGTMADCCSFPWGRTAIWQRTQVKMRGKFCEIR
jgi:hypothetical protein